MVFDAIIGIVEAAWALSVAVVPALFLVFFIVYFMLRGEEGSYVEVWISSQRDMALAYGVPLIAGLLLGGLVQYLLPGIGVVPGTVLVLLVGAYALYLRDPPVPMDLDTGTSWAYAALIWVPVPFLAVVALVLNQTLLQHVLALLFYTVIFWKL